MIFEDVISIDSYFSFLSCFFRIEFMVCPQGRKKKQKKTKKQNKTETGGTCTLLLKKIKKKKAFGVTCISKTQLVNILRLVTCACMCT